MARLKRDSTVLAEQEQRAAGMASISPTLDVGNGLTMTLYKGHRKK